MGNQLISGVHTSPSSNTSELQVIYITIRTVTMALIVVTGPQASQALIDFIPVA